MKMVAEGLNMMIPIKNFLNTQKNPFPFLEMVIEIVGKPQDATKIFAHFLNRL